MSKVIVIWNMPHVMSIGTGSMDSSIVTIVPGTNELTKEVFDHISNITYRC